MMTLSRNLFFKLVITVRVAFWIGKEGLGVWLWLHFSAGYLQYSVFFVFWNVLATWDLCFLWPSIIQFLQSTVQLFITLQFIVYSQMLSLMILTHELFTHRGIYSNDPHPWIVYSQRHLLFNDPHSELFTHRGIYCNDPHPWIVYSQRHLL